MTLAKPPMLSRVLTTRAGPVPVAFMVVIAAVIALFIFFGAWAVSVDAANSERQLSFAVGNATLGVNPLPSQPIIQPEPAQTQGGESAADTWWGNGLLLACPLH